MTSGTIYYYYTHAYQYSVRRYEPKTLSEYFDRSLAYNIDLEDKYKLSRLAAILFWLKEHSSGGNPMHMLFGHGLGAAKHDGLIVGHVASQPKYKDKKIGLSALSRLLWDVGLIGTIIYIIIFVAAFFSARRMKNNRYLSEIEQAFMQGAEIACLFFIMSLPYQLSIINVQSFNAFSMFILGYIAFWHRKVMSIKAMTS